jgi:NAD(P)-dependent dehydrogenase (short-subunit alcohol dehydrogenase family)
MSGPQKPIDEIDLSDFMQVMNINVAAFFLCTQQAFKVFKSQEPQGGK